MLLSPLLALVSPLLALALGTTALAPAAAAASSRSASGSPTIVVTPKACAHANLRPAPSNLAAIETATLCLINALRKADHRHSLRFNADLHTVAVGQASEMVLGDYFGDDNRAGQTPLQRIVASSYPAHAARVSTAQNIGWGTGPDATPAAMVRAWLLSPPHRKIILTKGYRDIGIGVTPATPASITAGALGATYTVEFGVRRKFATTARHKQPAPPHHT
jgi:uncharacterized protein YkwD